MSNGKLAIVVLDRGWVYVGRVAIDGIQCVIHDARNVHRWGTTKGLGELALGGPTARTVLNDAGTVRAPLRAVIHTLDCREESWSPKSGS